MTENDLEQTCIEWFRELGWEYVHGETISPGGFAPERAHYNEVVRSNPCPDEEGIKTVQCSSSSPRVKFEPMP